MRIIRGHSSVEKIFPEYFNDFKYCEAKISNYTHFQKVSANEIVAYSFVSDSIIMLNEYEYEIVKMFNFLNDNVLFEILKTEGFCVSNEVDEYVIMKKHREIISKQRSKMMKVVILPTTYCNARCQYCIGKNNKNENMSIETAKQAVKYIVDTAQNYESIRYDWYGGEPLIKEDIITYICDEVKRKLPNILFSSVITTNLSLFDENMLKKAIHNWHIYKVNITFDGGEKEHNCRKNYIKNSFNGYKHTIKCIQMLLKNDVTVFCRFNIDKNNFDELKTVLNEIKPFISSDKFYFFISALRGETCNTEYYSTDEYNKLFYDTGVLLNENGIHNAIDSFVPKVAMGFCLAKNHNCFVIGTDGSLYRCNLDDMIEENTTGTIFKGLAKNKIYDDFLSIELDEKCKGCKFLPICQGGCPIQAKFASTSNSQCDKFIYKLEAISKLLVEYY